MMGVKLPKRATVCILTGEPEEIKMKWEEMIDDEEIVQVNLKVQEIEEDFDLDAFYAYWMDVADPRGTYLETLAAFKFEQASGSGEWDY